MVRDKFFFLITIFFSFNAFFSSSALDDFSYKGTVEELSWSDIYKKTYGGIYQIFSCDHEYNYFEPFKAPVQSMSCGTGFVISPDGYILTNFHVAYKAAYLYAQLPLLGKERLELTYVGGSPTLDIALLKLTENAVNKIKAVLNDQELVCLNFGDSDEQLNAQEGMAIGYPLGQENDKISLGNIAGRQSTEVGECIQTTAPINPGNSGGPFFNKKGEVIGICVSKIVRVEAEGIGYILPINAVKKMVKHLLSNPLVAMPDTGIVCVSTTESTLHFLGAPTSDGLYVAEVIKGGLAEQGGIHKGDVLYAVANDQNRHIVDRYGYINVPWSNNKVGLADYFLQQEIGSTVEITVYREGTPLVIPFTILNTKQFAIDWHFAWIEPDLDYEVFGGMVFTQLTLNHIAGYRALAKQVPFDLSFVTKYERKKHRHEPRVVMTGLYRVSPLHQTQWNRSGDVIIEKINGILIRTIEDLRVAVRKSIGQDLVTIEFEGGSFVCFPVKDIVRYEPSLAARYGFAVSPLTTELALGCN